MIQKLLVLLLTVLALGCSSLQGFLFPEAYDKDARVAWEKDMKMQINGKVYYGTAVVDEAEIYSIAIYPAFKEIDRLQWRTCHQDGHTDKAVVHGRWPWSKKQEYFVMNFKVRDIERDRACSLDIEAVTAKRKVMSFGMVVFPDIRPYINLGATVECNGKLLVTGGQSLCQGHHKSIQRIAFRPGVIQDIHDDSKCPPMKEVSPGVFEYLIPKEKCVYQFISQEKTDLGRYREHILTTFGYEQTPPAEL
jgi:hypothetical protein